MRRVGIVLPPLRIKFTCVHILRNRYTCSINRLLSGHMRVHGFVVLSSTYMHLFCFRFFPRRPSLACFPSPRHRHRHRRSSSFGLEPSVRADVTHEAMHMRTQSTSMVSRSLVVARRRRAQHHFPALFGLRDRSLLTTDWIGLRP